MISRQLRRFETVIDYNTVYPDCALPVDPWHRNLLRGYTAAARGIEDDLAGTGTSMTVEFLPGGAPAPTQLDRVGTVVATRWGNPPYVLLAERVSLRVAWEAIISWWPTRLSQVVAVLPPLGSTDR
jgi:hypothetical protein